MSINLMRSERVASQWLLNKSNPDLGPGFY